MKKGRGNIHHTHEKFISLCREKHGDRYEYIGEYKGMHEEIIVLCSRHGEFRMKPVHHVHNGLGCRQCYLEDTRLTNFKKVEEKILAKHDHISNISSVGYEHLRSKVDVECKYHGVFKSNLSNVLASSVGTCSGCRRREESFIFIEKATELHENKYVYYPEDYFCSRTLTKIFCTIHKEDFYQRPSAQLQGQGCPLCGKEDSITNSTHTTENFIEKAKAVHGDKFDYNKTIYSNAFCRLIITCKIEGHGDTTLTASNHLQGQGCKVCSSQNSNTGEFISKSKTLYDYLSYDEVNYVDNRTKVKIRCNLHSCDFYVTPLYHLSVQKCCGCPECGIQNVGRWSISKVLNTPNLESKIGYLYRGKLSTFPEDVFKIGFTNSLRYRENSYRADLLPYPDVNFYYISHLELPYLMAFKLEVFIKKLLSKFRYKHDLQFGGKTEVYHISENNMNILDDIFNKVGVYDSIVHYLEGVNSNTEVIIKDWEFANA